MGATVVCLEEVSFVHPSFTYILITACRPYLHIYAHSDEVEEVGVINLNGVNIESNPEMEALLGVRHCFSNYLLTHIELITKPCRSNLHSPYSHPPIPTH